MPNDTTVIRERLDRAGEEARLRDPSDLAKFVDAESIQTDASGEIVGLDDAIADLRKTRPYLFKDHFAFDPSRPSGEQITAFDRQLKPREHEGHKLVKGLELNELSAQEFQDVLHVYTTAHPDVMAIRRLETVSKRQANDRNAESPRSHPDDLRRAKNANDTNRPRSRSSCGNRTA
jgi:hypothetical protein